MTCKVEEINLTNTEVVIALPHVDSSAIFKNEFWKLFFLSATGYAGCGALPYVSGLTTTVTNMSIIYALSPIFIVLLSAYIYKERLKFLQYCAVLLSLFGVFFIIFKGELTNFFNLNFSIGDVWIFGAAICWSLFSIFLINWKSKFNIIERFTLMSLLGSLILIPFFLIEHFLFLPTNFNFNYFLVFLLSNILYIKDHHNVNVHLVNHFY